MKIILIIISAFVLSVYSVNAQVSPQNQSNIKYLIEGGFQSNSNNSNHFFVGGGFEKKIISDLSWKGIATINRRVDTFTEFNNTTSSRRAILLELGLSAKYNIGSQNKWFIEGGGILRRNIWRQTVHTSTTYNNELGLQFGLGYQTRLKEGNQVTIGAFLKQFNKSEGLLGGIKLGYYFSK